MSACFRGFGVSGVGRERVSVKRGDGDVWDGGGVGWKRGFRVSRHVVEVC